MMSCSCSAVAPPEKVRRIVDCSNTAWAEWMMTGLAARLSKASALWDLYS
jgi:hypothetical protein